MALFVEIIGWAGALLVLAAYVGVSTGQLAGGSATFQWLNAVGTTLFVVNTWWHAAFPSMVLNIIWSVVGFYTLWRIFRRRISLS
ncbi:hypothetical protein SAMN05518849_103134 [Sphingobium sp. AP50]|uniref:CBU_0592 family membrane protein n=1 Tax=Sphingobium sp. AP50 TaxID=1884369 RepID=UPI0008C51CD1|nr:hypothetical protein [Sphingobium sp. AP50]SEJ14490.1 hypothetical protein SAMN05518849_103134 [Sphingobium sp. AP50]